ncbi:uncharacterized protein C8R40DRAFT_1069261 [Lentinula edodes]|uniref:uncharacterized protein n=1 Tax=Lentinula edodes TaxID=5353 RepID=UPI001E8E8B3C|nr:uncharacterized protein C8R40DRAFT_1069261 [Lentinula edodes]KAH7875671.1 hypothetical protein C8R40DRAFT_1069261 [Lentinula edodes]
MPLPEAFEVPQLDATNKSFPSYRPYVDDRSLPLKAREATNDQCVDLTLAQAKTIPNFWQKVQSYADGRYGKGSRKILMYDKHYPDVHPAKVCVTSQAVQIKTTGSPSCQTNNATTGGIISGTHGIVSVMIQQGFTGTSSFTISEAASIGITNAFRVRMKFPDVVNTRGGPTAYTTITNTQSANFDISFNEMVTTTFNMTVQPDQNCQAMEAVRSCTLQGIGEIPFIASGKFWIEYDDKTYDHLVNEKTHDDHYKFEVDFKDVLPAASQRTIKAFFKGSFSTSSHGNYSAVCTGGSG